ncbi:hypothetical protein F4781DRAFT_30719 [Annulohypoxylon bovei var. microspora]|nr:hypothetical protein F4781DRAFT_30719 [Annulohypoxylon bovei var. microspora]
MSKVTSSDSSDERAGKGKGKAPTDVTSLAGVRKNYNSSVNQVHQQLKLLAANQAKVNEDLNRNMNVKFKYMFNLITNLMATIATGKSINQPNPSPAKTNLSPSELGTAAPEPSTAALTDTANQPPAKYATEYAEGTREPAEYAECTGEPTEEEEAATQTTTQTQLAIQHEALMARSYHEALMARSYHKALMACSYHDAQEGWCSQASTTAATCSRHTWTTVTPYGYDDHG